MSVNFSRERFELWLSRTDYRPKATANYLRDWIRPTGYRPIFQGDKLILIKEGKRVEMDYPHWMFQFKSYSGLVTSQKALDVLRGRY